MIIKSPQKPWQSEWKVFFLKLFTQAKQAMLKEDICAYGKHGNPESGSGTGTGQINECFKLGSVIRINSSSSLFYIHRKMDDDMRGPFKKRYEYKEHSSYHFFQLN